MLDRRYFVYMLQSVSRNALYIGLTNLLTARVIEHRSRKYPNSFSAKYRTWRLVYYEEFSDAEAAWDRERQLKGWSRAKKEALIVKMNPRWRDLMAEWEEKYGIEFRLDGRIVAKISQADAKGKTQDPSTTASPAPATSSANSMRSIGPGKARVPPSLRMLEVERAMIEEERNSVLPRHSAGALSRVIAKRLQK